MTPVAPRTCRTVKGCIDMRYNTDHINSSARGHLPPLPYVKPVLTEKLHSQCDHNLRAGTHRGVSSASTHAPIPVIHAPSVSTPSSGQILRPYSIVSAEGHVRPERRQLPGNESTFGQDFTTYEGSMPTAPYPSNAPCQNIKERFTDPFVSFDQASGSTEVQTNSGDKVTADGQGMGASRCYLVHEESSSGLYKIARPSSQTNGSSRAQALHAADRPFVNKTLHHDSGTIRARHDRDSLYVVRTRPDGSQSLIKVMPSGDTRVDANRPLDGCAATERPSGPRDIEDQANAGGVDSTEEDGTDENSDEFKTRLIRALKQMMFVSGEQAEPSTETTWMIEEIVREQVVEMLKEATMLANRRGSKSISIVDLIFQIRHNPAKVSRLKTFLSWKDVRKNVKDSDDKAGGADADALDLEDGALPGANPAAPQKTSTNRKAKLVLPWEVQSFYNETVPEREDEEDEEEEEQNEATLARLASADERTKNMTREEYVYWSDCRQASFTFRKGKRFREWAGFGTIIDSKPNDDVVDILGFLTFEIVQTLTEEALRVKNAEDLANKKANGSRGDIENSKKRKREGCTLFEMVEEDKTPVEPKHVREAFRRLQLVPKKYTFMRQGYAGVRTPLRMI